MARGRGATPIRPGYIIKDILSGKQPLLNPSSGQSGLLVDEACATDMHNTYQQLIYSENHLRPRTRWLRGMTVESFAKLTRFARLLGLVEFVHEEPMFFPPVTGSFYRVEMEVVKSGPHRGERRPIAVISTRKMLRITTLGKTEGRAWGDLRRAWQEDWRLGITGEERVIPFKPEAPPTTPVAEVPKPEIPVKQPAHKPAAGQKPWSSIKLSEHLTVTQVKKLRSHLQNLAKIGLHDEAVAREIEHIGYSLGDWDAELEGQLEVDTDPEKRALHTKQLNVVRRAYTSLTEGKLQPAIAALGELT